MGLLPFATTASDGGKEPFLGVAMPRTDRPHERIASFSVPAKNGTCAYNCGLGRLNNNIDVHATFSTSMVIRLISWYWHLITTAHMLHCFSHLPIVLELGVLVGNNPLRSERFSKPGRFFRLLGGTGSSGQSPSRSRS